MLVKYVFEIRTVHCSQSRQRQTMRTRTKEYTRGIISGANLLSQEDQLQVYCIRTLNITDCCDTDHFSSWLEEEMPAEDITEVG